MNIAEYKEIARRLKSKFEAQKALAEKCIGHMKDHHLAVAEAWMGAREIVLDVADSETEECRECEGRGTVWKSWDGPQPLCLECDGKGRIAKSPNKRFKECYNRWTNKIYSPASDVIHPEPRFCYAAGWEDCKKEVLKIIEDEIDNGKMSIAAAAKKIRDL